MNLLVLCAISFITGCITPWLIIFMHWLYQNITMKFRILSKDIYGDWDTKVVYTIRHGLTKHEITCGKDEKEYNVGDRVKVIKVATFKGKGYMEYELNSAMKKMKGT